MKREGAIITTLLIDRPGQTKLFQVKIPREVKNIIGIELGFVWLEGARSVMHGSGDWQLFKQKRNILIGDVKLQSYEKANIFYAGELMLNRNSDFADFTSQFFNPQLYTHQTHAHEDEVKVSGDTTLIQGAYRDKLNNALSGTYSYKVNLCLWMEAKEDLNTIEK